MSFATEANVREALGRDLTAEETDLVQVLLDEADDVILAYLSTVLEDPIPGAVVRVAARMVARVFLQTGMIGADNVTQQTGPFSQTVKYSAGATNGSPWLSSADKSRLRPYRRSLGSATVQSFHTGRYRQEL